MKKQLAAPLPLLFLFLCGQNAHGQTSGSEVPEGVASCLQLVLGATCTLVPLGILVFLLLKQRKKNTARPGVAPNARPASTAAAVIQKSTVTPASKKLIFISYRRSDSTDITGRIYDRLIEHFGKDRVFKDVDSIPLGLDFRQHLQHSVGRCDVLLAIVGLNWLISGDTGKPRLDEKDDHLRLELEAALHREIPIIPVLVQGAVLPLPENLPASLQNLAYRQSLQVRPDPDFHGDVERLIRGIDDHFAANPTKPAN